MTATTKRGLAVRKMPGSDQDQPMRGLSITHNGIRFGEAFAGTSDSLLGFSQA